MQNEDAMKYGAELLISGLKVVNPELTDQEAEKIIVNVGMWLEIKRLQKGNHAE